MDVLCSAGGISLTAVSLISRADGPMGCLAYDDAARWSGTNSAVPLKLLVWETVGRAAVVVRAA